MNYIPHTNKEIKEMLNEIGLDELSQLTDIIPDEVKFKSNLKLDKGISEQEIVKKLKILSSKNNNFSNKAIFLGAGFYDHYVPIAIDFISSRGEFLTAYTPYQAEASQGTLQSIFEYQTAISRLTKHDISNASMYDGGSALAEAIIMAHHINKKGKVLISPTINKEHYEIIKTYTAGMNLEIIYPETDKLYIDLDTVKKYYEDNEIGVIALQVPNFYGMIEDYENIVKYAKEKKSIVVASVYPTALGLIEAPATFGADITVGEGQPLGNYISLGGPHFGFMSCKEKFLRKIPGRIVGETKDREGKKAYCLVLQTREQHIKRERATSNICSNQALCALRGILYLSMTGEEGLKKVANHTYHKAHYLASEIEKLSNFSVKKDLDFFNEFIVECKADTAAKINKKIKNNGMIGGFDLSRANKSPNLLMFAVTEKRTKKEMDELVKILSR